MSNQHAVYIGIDIHSKEHIAAIMPLPALQHTSINWEKAKFIRIKNNLTDFEKLETTILGYIQHGDDAVIGIDHTGGHYSEPLVFFLQNE